MKKFNINDYMYIRITDAGWKHLRETAGEKYIKDFIKIPECEKIINGEMWYRLQCWSCFDLMPINFGGSPLFEPDVIFNANDIK